MMFNLDPGTLLMAAAGLATLAFFFGAALDAIMHEDGFGPLGNMVLFVAGFFGGAYAAKTLGIPVHDLKMVAACGLGGAFALVSVLALLKAGLSRF